MRSDPWKWPDLGTAAGNSHVNFAAAGSGGLWGKEVSKLSLFERVLDYLAERYAPTPWSPPITTHRTAAAPARRPLYSAEERLRRDSTAWTLVQGVLAPLQFAVFLVSLFLVLRYLTTTRGYEMAALSVVAKTLVLYAIMITGAIWEKKVFGRYLFAPAFYWEDMVSMLVIALHTAYLFAAGYGWGSDHSRMVLALAAYAAYALNAAQFLLKFRAARLDGPHVPAGAR